MSRRRLLPLLLVAAVAGVRFLFFPSVKSGCGVSSNSGSTSDVLVATSAEKFERKKERWDGRHREHIRVKAAKEENIQAKMVSRRLLEGVGRYLRDPATAYRLKRLYEIASAVLEGSGVNVDPWLLISICLVETGCDPLVVRDETVGISRKFRSYNEACTYVKKLRRRGHLYAVGLGQVVPRYWRKFVPEQDECMLLIPAKSFLVMGRIIQELANRYGWRWQAIAAYNGNPYRRRPRRYARSVIARYSVISSYFVE